MTFEEILNELKNYEDTPEYETYVSGQVNTDRVSKFLGTDEGKKFLQPQLDISTFIYFVVSSYSRNKRLKSCTLKRRCSLT